MRPLGGGGSWPSREARASVSRSSAEEPELRVIRAPTTRPLASTTKAEGRRPLSARREPRRDSVWRHRSAPAPRSPRRPSIRRRSRAPAPWRGAPADGSGGPARRAAAFVFRLFSAFCSSTFFCGTGFGGRTASACGTRGVCRIVGTGGCGGSGFDITAGSSGTVSCCTSCCGCGGEAVTGARLIISASGGWPGGMPI